MKLLLLFILTITLSSTTAKDGAYINSSVSYSVTDRVITLFAYNVS